MRNFPAILFLVLCHASSAQQMDLSWATPAAPTIVRTKFAGNGDVFALGNGSNGVLLQRYSAAGSLIWTKTLSAPTLYGIDMDVDAGDNVYLYVGFTTGQLDLDPGPLTTLVNPGKTYARYTGSGQFQWGFSVANTTDMSENYGGISCDDAGNLYITGDLGQGTYDMDPGPGVTNLVVGNSTTGSFIARYRPDGSLHWADVRTWSSGYSYSRDIAANPDGSAFDVIQYLENGGPLNSQIDVDPGPGTFLVYTETQNLLRFDSTYAFVAQGDVGFGEQRLAMDADGHAYLLAAAYAGSGFWALKFTRSGQDLNEVYQTSLTSTGNLRLADIVPDGQGGSLGAYSNNCSPNYYRFFKMNVSGLVDFNLALYSGTDCTLPVVKGFDLRGSTFVIGSVNNNYTVDFDPGVGVTMLPGGADDGVVALYDWCSGVPFDPFGIDVLSTTWCVGDTVTVAADAFGDASGYTWDAGTWTIATGQGNDTLHMIADDAGPTTVGLAATNACGSSAPVTLQLTAGNATAVLPADEVVCDSLIAVLDPGPCAGCTYMWQPGGATTATLAIDIDVTTTFIVSATQGNCTVSDTTTITVDPCMGIADDEQGAIRLGPVPIACGEELTLTGTAANTVLRITTMDGRAVGASFRTTGTVTRIPTAQLVMGGYLLHGAGVKPLRFVVAE